MRRLRQTRSLQAQSILEVAAGIIVLVLILLFLVDVGAILLANSVNDLLVKNVARAAATVTNGPDGLGDLTVAERAANAVVNNFQRSGIIDDAELVLFSWSGSDPNPENPPATYTGPTRAPAGQVLAMTRLSVRTIVPVWGIPERTDFFARVILPATNARPAAGEWTTGPRAIEAQSL